MYMYRNDSVIECGEIQAEKIFIWKIVNTWMDYVNDNVMFCDVIKYVLSRNKEAV